MQIDVETQALLRLMHQVKEDAPDTRKGRESYPPLCVELLTCLLRMFCSLFYQRFMPRSVMVDYLKVLFGFHLALYHYGSSSCCLLSSNVARLTRHVPCYAVRWIHAVLRILTAIVPIVSGYFSMLRIARALPGSACRTQRRYLVSPHPRFREGLFYG